MRDGSFIEQIGFYDPKTDPPDIRIDEEKAVKWVRSGAQPSGPVEHMLRSAGILDKAKSSAAS